MLRWLTVFGLIAVAVAAVVYYLNGGPPGTVPLPFGEAPALAQGGDVKGAQPSRVPDAPPAAQPWSREVGVMPLAVISGGRLTAVQTQQVPTVRDGQLLFIGTEIKVAPGEKPPPKAIQQEVGVLMTEAQAGDPQAPDWVAYNNKWYRPLRKREEVQPNRAKVIYLEKWFMPLEPGTKVQEGQMLGLIDPSIALDELSSKIAKLNAAEAERVAADKTKDEARERWIRAETLYKKGAGPLEDVTANRLGYDRYVSETLSKTEAVTVAGREARQTETALDQHVIRAKIGGQVKTIARQKGEAVKALTDTVLELQDDSRLRVNARVEVQDLQHLKEGDVVAVEATRMASPALILSGHLDEVTGVAVSKSGEIVSVSLDRTARVWDRKTRKERHVLRVKSPVRAVACTPKGAAANLCVTGAADGVARLYDLEKDGDPFVRQFADANGHREGINCVAFSPDGKRVATGGDDKAVCLWDAESGKLIQRLPAAAGHRGAVTSVQFLPGAEGKLSLVTAGRDNALILWPMSEDGTAGEPTKYPNRGGEVTALGVNPKGGQLVFDQGKELHLLSPANGALVGSLTTPGASNFSKMALFSPDGRLILTAGGEGRLQLWRTPTAETRGYDLQDMVWARQRDEQAAATCGAFDPNGSFVVTGTNNRQVVVWPMPSPKDLETRLTAKVINLDREVSAGQVRVTAELDNPGYLLPGETVTMVVYPKKQ